MPSTGSVFCQLPLWVSVMLSVKWDVEGILFLFLALLTCTGKGL